MKRSITLSVFLVLCSGAAGQSSPYVSVSSPKQVSPEGEAWWEVSAGGSTIDHRVLVVAPHTKRPRVTTNALAVNPVWVDGPIDLTPGDTFVVPHPFADASAGRVYVGGSGDASAMGMYLTYYDPGDVWHQNQVFQLELSSVSVDKAWLAIGPSLVNPGTVNYYIGSSRLSCTGEKLWMYSTTSPLSNSWPNFSAASINTSDAPCAPTGASCKYRGWSMLPVVTDDGQIVAVARDTNVALGAPGCYNERRPYVIWSNDDGHTWLPDAPLPVQLGVQLVEAASTKVPKESFADTPWFVDKRCGAPAIAIDRATNAVYVAFAARRSSPLNGEQDWNTDIWIFRGERDQDGNWVFGNDLSNQVLHLTDPMLGLELNADDSGPDQFTPAIAIDCAGAINLMFYDNRAETQTPEYPDDDGTHTTVRWADVYYARIRNWPGANPDIYTKRLTPTSFPVVKQDVFLADYHTIASAGDQGKWFYPVYVAKKAGNGGDPAGWSVRTCFMHSVFIRECLSDLNLNRAADTGDVDLFWEAYDEAAPMADVTDDGYVNSEDVDEFVDVYSDAIGN